MMSCTGNRGTICWKVILILVTMTMQLVYPVVSLEESFCAGTGYYNLNYGDTYSIRGYRTIGWDRLFAVDKPFTSFFWGVKAILREKNDNPTEDIRYLRDQMGTTLNGWIHISIDRQAFPFHYIAVWAVTQRNEVYGTFLFYNKYTTNCPGAGFETIYSEPYAYIPCSAGPANVDTVPNMFIYANLKRTPSDPSNKQSFIESNVIGGTRGQHKIHLLWRSPTQSYCNRPRQFQFIFAYTPIKSWSIWAKKWDGATRPVQGMWDEGNAETGPIVHKSPWIFPNYYGHPSNHDPVTTLYCTGYIVQQRVAWVNKVQGLGVDNKWYNDALYKNSYPKTSMKEGRFDEADVMYRSTCKGANPATTTLQAFGGRCTQSVSETSHVNASAKAHLKCSDKNENVGKSYFKANYSEYLDKFMNLMTNDCECRIITADMNTASSTTQRTTVATTAFRAGGSNRLFGRRSRSLVESDAQKSRRDKEIYQTIQDDTKDTVTVYKRDHDVCSTDHVNLSSRVISDKGGVCVQTPVGKLVFGVRQFHGVTSLCASLVITPMSIFVARYHKGDMILEDGKVQVRPWYLAHILLVFPAIWMYASGMATISRQVDVIGYSLTLAAKLHRMIGVVTIALLPVHVITGLLRPLNLSSRRVVIFVHWLGGTVQHILEIALCCTAFLIPASPTTGTSVFSSHFGTLHESFESQLVLGWFVFSVAFHIFQTVRVKRRDCRNGIDSRSVFPVIIPQFSGFDEELILDVGEAEPIVMADDVQDLWFERGSLLIFGLVSGIVFLVAVVSLYQELHENLYYGFGPMSCTHTAQGRFIRARSGDTTDNHAKMENMCKN